MAKFRIDTLDKLARQLTFSPHDVRVAQIAAAEDLLHTLDPAKAYPLEFVIFRITGYHPRHAEALLFPGEALQHDLGQLIETVSASLDLQACAIREPVLSIDDVTEKFNVTSKTIQRWRRKGLPARRFLFADGKRRVGFLLSSVERFVSIHENQVAQSANFTQVDDAERETILRRAARLAHRGCCVREITRRIARKLHRSPLTILHIVRKFDQENAERAIFPSAAPPISDKQKSFILRKHEKGVAIRRLASRLNRPPGDVYRVLLEIRTDRIKRRKIRFIDDPLYHQDDAPQVVDSIVAQEEIGSGRTSPEETRIPRDIPPYLQDLYRTPLLTPAKERALFLKFNYHKCQFVTARRQLDPELTRRHDLDRLEELLDHATQVKNAIVRANLRLVVSVARKHLRPSLSLMELISEGNITLMRAVESFDFHKGNRFSTYATLALMKGFARTVPQLLSASKKSSGDVAILADVADRRAAPAADSLQRRDEVTHLLSRLSDRERAVLTAHFGLNNQPAAETCEQLARRLGLTKQRVRQIQQSALDKLRAVAGLPAN